MTQEAQQIVAAFDNLTVKDQREVAEILLRRLLDGADGPLPDEALVEAAEALFLDLDLREASVGQPEAR